MRSKTQNVKRYFTSAWSAFGLWTSIVIVTLTLIDEPTPDWAVGAFLVLHGVAGAVIGFIHGATAMYAKQLDQSDISGENHDGEEDDSYFEHAG